MHTQLALRARQIPAAEKLGDYALGLRPRPSTPGYPSGTAHTEAIAEDFRCCLARAEPDLDL